MKPGLIKGQTNQTQQTPVKLVKNPLKPKLHQEKRGKTQLHLEKCGKT